MIFNKKIYDEINKKIEPKLPKGTKDTLPD